MTKRIVAQPTHWTQKDDGARSDRYGEIVSDVARLLRMRLASEDPREAAAGIAAVLVRRHELIPLDLAEPPERFPRLIANAARLGPNALAVLEEIAARMADKASEDFEAMIDERASGRYGRPANRAALRVIDGGGRRSGKARRAPALRAI
jgi:hypothetical protein